MSTPTQKLTSGKRIRFMSDGALSDSINECLPSVAPHVVKSVAGYLKTFVSVDGNTYGYKFPSTYDKNMKVQAADLKPAILQTIWVQNVNDATVFTQARAIETAQRIRGAFVRIAPALSARELTQTCK